MRKVVINGCYGGASLSKEACEFMDLDWDGYYYLSEKNRTDSKLVECVETLGKQASGEGSSLYIEEYDDENYDYEIDEHEGYETLRLIPIINLARIMEMSEGEIKIYFDKLGVLYK